MIKRESVKHELTFPFYEMIQDYDYTDTLCVVDAVHEKYGVFVEAPAKKTMCHQWLRK